ncbi:MAG: TIGR04282 family arsenosugar biosynthesis glycosyltransferase [Verrucomicrobia bacterium]|nr:TIGR04282 family arsenosugar biosynthesis glycosyltransferase [Verrucomicrobiota bacterium]
MNVVALFLKAPQIGAVKTRLAKSLGEEGALQAYRQLVEFLLTRLGNAASIHVHYTPDFRQIMEDWLGDEYQYSLQVGADLGARLIHALEEELAFDADRLIFLGGDCPFVDQVRLDWAFRCLDQHDVVLGPAMDGGYYLIGMKEKIPALFQNIPWGTETVLQTTLDTCAQLNLSVSLLPEESDVDDLAGWESARDFMANL